MLLVIEQRGIDKSTTNRNHACVALATTSEAGAVDRHAVVHGFVLSVADIIACALRAGALLVPAGFILSLEVSTPPHPPNGVRQLIQQRGPAHAGGGVVFR